MKRYLSVFAVALLIAAIGLVSAPRSDAEAAEYPGIRPQQEAAQYPGADNITVYLECQFDGRVRLRLQWTQYNFGLQFVDLSLFNNGWVWGTFIGIGPYGPGQSAAIWEGLIPGAWHYVRINTLTSFGWQPSSTIAFLTRNDCFGYPPPLPQPPILPYPPPTPGFCQGTSTPATYQAGLCPPASECPATATILIYPPPAQGCVFPRRGTGGVYFQGEIFNTCYWVNQAMWVRIVHQTPTNTLVLLDGWDDGTGGCVRAPTPLGGPGQRTQTLYGGPQGATQVLDTTHFTVQ